MPIPALPYIPETRGRRAASRQMQDSQESLELTGRLHLTIGVAITRITRVPNSQTGDDDLNFKSRRKRKGLRHGEVAIRATEKKHWTTTLCNGSRECHTREKEKKKARSAWATVP